MASQLTEAVDGSFRLENINTSELPTYAVWSSTAEAFKSLQFDAVAGRFVLLAQVLSELGPVVTLTHMPKDDPEPIDQAEATKPTQAASQEARARFSSNGAEEGRARFNPGPNKKAHGLWGNPAYQRYLADHRVKLRQLEAIAGGWNTYRPTKY